MVSLSDFPSEVVILSFILGDFFNVIISEDIKENLNIVYESSNLDNFEKIINKYGTLSEKIIQLYGKQLLNGLQYLHKKIFLLR